MTFTERDDALIRALLGKIRLITFAQIARAWWPDTDSGKTNAKRRVQDLVEAKLLIRERAFARPMLELTAPVFVWKPGQEDPDPEKLSYQVQSRWEAQAGASEPRAATVYFASRRAANVLGGAALARIKNHSQVTHDLHVTELYLKLLRETPPLAQAWVGEEILAPSRVNQKLPDAILVASSGEPKLVMEFGGAYPPDRVQAFHDDCKTRGLPYEFW
jgi:hypothetical protein